MLQASRAAAATAAGACSRARKPEERAGEGDRDPGEVDREQRDQHPLEDRRAADRHDLIHLVGAVGGQQQAAAEHEEPGEPRAAASRMLQDGLALLRRRPAPQRLGRHVEVLFGRHERLRAARGRLRSGSSRDLRCPTIKPCLANRFPACFEDQAHLTRVFVARVKLECDAYRLSLRIGPEFEVLERSRANG